MTAARPVVPWFVSRCVLLLLALGVAASPIVAVAQGAKAKKGSEGEKVTGKVTEVERKGKAATLTVEKEDGGTLEVALTTKLPVLVTGKGDASCIHPKAWVSSSQAVLANQELFAKNFTVYLGKAPPAHCGPEPMSTEVYQICGQVTAAGSEAFVLNCGEEFGTHKVSFEQGARVEVTVNSSEHDLIEAGNKIELEGMTRAGKFVPSKATVTVEKLLTGDDLFPDAKKAKKAAPAKAAATAKKTGKKDETEGDGAAAGNSGDPFGVLGNDTKPDAKKAPDKKAPDKKPGTGKAPDKK